MTAPLEAGAVLRCPVCRLTQIACGGENAMWCNGGDRHRFTRMEIVIDCESSDDVPPTPLHPSPCRDCGTPTRGQLHTPTGIVAVCPACFGLPGDEG